VAWDTPCQSTGDPGRACYGTDLPRTTGTRSYAQHSPNELAPLAERPTSSHVGDSTSGEFGLIPGMLLRAKSFTAAGSVLHEREIRSAEYDSRVGALSCLKQLRVRAAKHVQAVRQRSERRGVAKEEAARRVHGSVLPPNLLSSDESHVVVR